MSAPAASQALTSRRPSWRALALPLVALLTLAQGPERALAQGASPRVAPSPPAPASLTAPRGNLLLTFTDGRVLSGAGLVGATLTIAGQPIRIAAAQPDPMDRTGETWLFDLRLADGGPFCEAAPDGTRLALPLPDAAAPGGFGMTCTGGAAGKCVRFGYAPWRLAPDGTTPLAPYHLACMNLVRAAYGSPEHGWTRNGMSIDLYDDLGIQRPDIAPDQAFEAGWTPAGAVCVAHVRVPEHGGLDAVVAEAPRLAGHTGAACTEAAARAAGALLFNRSAPPR